MLASWCPIREAPGTEKGKEKGTEKAQKQDPMSAEAEGWLLRSRLETQTHSSLLPCFLKQAPAGQRAASLPGSLALGQVHKPAICSSPAFYNGIKYGMHVPRHTRGHGNQATGSTLLSRTQSTPAQVASQTPVTSGRAPSAPHARARGK